MKTNGFWAELKLPMYVQLSQIAFAIVWNVLGVWRLAHGEPAPGPTASLLVAGIELLVMVALILGATWGLMVCWRKRKLPS